MVEENTLWKICLFVMEFYISQLVLEKTQKSSKFMFQSPPTRKKNMRSVADEIWSTKRSQRFCLWPVRSFDRLGPNFCESQIFESSVGTTGDRKMAQTKLVDFANWLGLFINRHLYHVWFTMWGPGTIAQLVNITTVLCVFFGRCNYTVDRWDYKHTYK